MRAKEWCHVFGHTFNREVCIVTSTSAKLYEVCAICGRTQSTRKHTLERLGRDTHQGKYRQ